MMKSTENDRKFMLFKRINAKQYAEQFIAIAEKKMVYSSDKFIIDNDNKETINQLYYYLINDADRFNGELNKGILIVGNIGCGKTLILETFSEIFNEHASKIIEVIHAKDIDNINKIKGTDYLNRRPLLIDDISKEQVIVNNFGTKSKPMEDLINERYKHETLTFATANIMVKDMPYVEHTKDRITQMFNTIFLPGKSRRK